MKEASKSELMPSLKMKSNVEKAEVSHAGNMAWDQTPKGRNTW